MAQLFRKILVPHDFSDTATKALELAVDLAATNRGRIIALHAAVAEYTPVSGFPPAGEMTWIPPVNLEKNLLDHLQAVVNKVTGRRRIPTECRVEIGDPSQCIIEAARDTDSIVMGTVGRTGLAHLLIGSVAEKVVRHAPVPVLTIRPDAAARAARRTARSRRATTRTRGTTTGRAARRRGGSS